MLATFLRMALVLVTLVASAAWAWPGPVAARVLKARQVVLREGPGESGELRVHPDYLTTLVFEADVVPGAVTVEDPERVRVQGRVVVFELVREMADGERVPLWVTCTRGRTVIRAVLMLVSHPSEVDTQVRLALSEKLARAAGLAEPSEPPNLMQQLLAGAWVLGQRLEGNALQANIFPLGVEAGVPVPTGDAAGSRHSSAQSRGSVCMGSSAGVVDQQGARSEVCGAIRVDVRSPTHARRARLGLHGVATEDGCVPSGDPGAGIRERLPAGMGRTPMSGKSSSSTSPVSSGEDMLPVDEAFPRWLPAGMSVGPWRILRWLGQGGYGVVYLSEGARPESAGGMPEPVALKLAEGRTPDDDPQARQRLLREAEILRRVVHPGVVRCLGQGEHQGVPYLVLEYVPGPNLYEWSAQRNRTAREVVGRVGSLALALEAVHGAGVFHRDLKGENILVRERDEQPVLLDFGVGDHEGASTLTGSGLPPGTAHYRSPEAVRFLMEEQEQARYCFTFADELYALGVILSRLLTDEYPFSPALPRPLLYERIEQTEPSAPVLLNPRVPRSVSDLAMRLLSKRPEDRGGSAREVYTAIQAALADGDGRWDEFLFQWDDGPSTHSRSTEKAGSWGPVAPGHEVELIHAAARARELRLRLRKNRALRKGPRLPASTTPAPVASSRPELKRSGTKSAWVLLAVACLSGLLWSSREPGASRAAWVSPTKEGPPVNTEKARSDLPWQEAEDSPIAKEDAHPLERCAAALAAGLVLSACAGVPAQPPRRDCPTEALAAMDRLQVPLDSPMHLYVDVNQPGEYTDILSFREGPLVSMTVRGLDGFAGYLPLGTLLYGYLWTQGKALEKNKLATFIQHSARLSITELGNFIYFQCL